MKRAARCPFFVAVAMLLPDHPLELRLPLIQSAMAEPAAMARQAPNATLVLPSIARGKAQADEIGNAFNAMTWAPPAPKEKPAPPAPPPKPTAPPLPFTYLGRYQDAPSPVVILAKGDRVYTVSEGDVIEGIYRVEAISSGRLEFIYLPLMIHQSLNTEGAS